MATRTEKVASRIAGRVEQGSKAVAAASGRVNSPRKLRKTKRALASAAKSVAAGAVAKGLRRAAKYAEEKADALEAPARRRSRIKTAAKMAGAAVAVAGAVLLARRASKK